MPWLHYFLRLNPLAPYLGLSLKAVLLTRMALEELGKRKQLDNNGRSATGQDDLLAQLIQGHLRAPDKFTESDVFAVAHGAM